MQDLKWAPSIEIIESETYKRELYELVKILDTALEERTGSNNVHFVLLEFILKTIDTNDPRKKEQDFRKQTELKLMAS